MSDGAHGAPADWYDDPHVPGQMRYFDGEVWTNHVHRPGELGNIGRWLGNTFTILGAHGLPAFLIALVTSLGGSGITLVGISLSVADLEIRDGVLEGLDVTAGLLMVGGLIVAMLWQGLGWIALNRYLQRAHSHDAPSITEAANRAFERFPALLGYALMVAAALMSLAVVITVAGLVSVALAVLLIFLMVPLGIFAFVKLGFVLQALAAAPTGTNWIRSSAALSSNRFWGVFGRLLLLTLIVGVATNIFSAFFGGGSPVDQEALGTLIDVDLESGDFTVDSFDFRDLIPSGGAAVLFVIVSSLLGAAGSVVSSSGTMRLYLDAGGESELAPPVAQRH